MTFSMVRLWLLRFYHGLLRCFFLVLHAFVMCLVDECVLFFVALDRFSHGPLFCIHNGFFID